MQGLGEMLTQMAPLVKDVIDRIKPVIDSPLIRFPYNLPLAQSTSIPANQRGQVLPNTDFSHSLEFPFEVHRIIFSQDSSHSFRDWRVLIKDQNFNQEMGKATIMVATLVRQNEGVWPLEFPWVVRPKGGGLTVTVDNLDANQAISVDINFEGYLLIPRT